MSFLGLSVDWSTVESIGFKPLPDGVYGAKITGATMSPTKKGDGKYIKLEFTLLGQKGIKGRKMFEYLTIVHPNENVVQSALRKFKKLAKLIGVDPDEISDTSELTGHMIGIKLTTKNDEKFGEQNKVVDFSEFNEEMLEQSLDSSSSF